MAPFLLRVETVQSPLPFQGEREMTMIRGTQIYIGQEAAELRSLENRFRSCLH